jgi:hypothetical protein
MANLIVQNSYNNPLLSNVSVRYNNPEYIADQVFPIITVPKRTGNYFVYDKENLRVPVETRRAGLSRANRVDFNTTKASYGPLTGRALEQGVDEDLLKEAQDPLAPLTDATMNVADKMLLQREQDLANMIFSTSNVTNNTTISGTNQWNNLSTSNPLQDVQSAILSMKQNTQTPNTMIMGYQVWTQLINHPVFQDRIKYSQLGVLTLELAARLFNVQRIIVGETIVNTAVEGQTDSLGFVWGKSVVLANIKPTPGIRDVSFGYHLTLAGEKFVDNWYEQALRGYFVRNNDYYDRKIIAQEAGYLLYQAVA